ncbi:MAG: hypothetical protein RL019_91, partial [Pseudomonadota bacterium]
MRRRRLVCAGAAMVGVGAAVVATPKVQAVARQGADFVGGPPAPDMPLRQ